MLSSRVPLLLLLLLLLLTTPLALTAPLHPRSATFDTLLGLTPLTNDFSRHESLSRPDKYFHEAKFSAHYDGRFASTGLPLETRIWHLRLLLRSYMQTMERIGVRTWLMHGCLLGWWWNGGIMPWDNDVDVMVEEDGMSELGGWWNMTVHHFTGGDLGLLDAHVHVRPPDPAGVEAKAKEDWGRETADTDTDTDTNTDKEHLLALEVSALNRQTLRQEVLATGKKYLLEVNPHYTDPSTKDTHNVIDARWIDTATGLYIDITTLHSAEPSSSNTTRTTVSLDPNNDHDPDDEDDEPLLYTKDTHAYSPSSIFPLRLTTFESIPVHIPYDYSTILAEEYGARALVETAFRVKGKGWAFDGVGKEWVERENGVGEKGKGKGWRREKTVEDVLEGREGEWVEGEEEGGDGEGGGWWWWW
ncbi:hypothetical protein NX059_010523 [Plenodomus lindquistii]|nr:hypothetical protein NX059_010523 [Plenodomus lindquistii]